MAATTCPRVAVSYLPTAVALLHAVGAVSLGKVKSRDTCESMLHSAVTAGLCDHSPDWRLSLVKIYKCVLSAVASLTVLQ